MKKLNTLLMIALAATVFTACHNNGTDSTAAADSANKSKDTLSAKKDSTLVSMDDAKFAVDAANGGMTEIELSKLAQSKTSNKQIKDFAGMMVMDHSKAGDQLKGIANLKHITLPDSVSNDSKQAITDMSKKSGADFDKAYVSKMVDDHTKVASMFETGSKNLRDTDLRNFAIKTLPTIKGHLAKIKAIQAGMK